MELIRTAMGLPNYETKINGGLESLDMLNVEWITFVETFHGMRSWNKETYFAELKRHRLKLIN